jgi:diguanylate cyclase (GGDEF)-like protein
MPEAVESEDAEVKKRTTILYLSNLFVDLFDTADHRLLHLIDSEIKKSGLFETIEVESLTETVFEKAQTLFPLFEVEPDENIDYQNLLIAAREELVKNSVDFINDFFKQQQLLKNLQVMVNQDSMTQLVNYRHFFELLDQEAYRAKRYDTHLSLLFIDIDHFKSVNDNYGHPTGDLVIKSVAHCLKSSLRESDVAARYGGEEFAVILPHTDQKGALIVAERLRNMIAEIKVDDGSQFFSVTASCGVTTVTGKMDASALLLVEQADQALYQAKKQGRNRSCTFEG